MMLTVAIHSLNLKESNTCGHKFADKTKLSTTIIRQNSFSLQIANIWNSLPETDTFRHQPLIPLKIDLIGIIGKETYLILALAIPLCLYYLHC